MPALSAEMEYLFRHGVMRDAAYQLLLPSERHELHRETAQVLHDGAAESNRETVANEIVDHATLALRHGADADTLRLQHDYLRIAGQRCSEDQELERGLGYLLRFRDHPLATALEKLGVVNEIASNFQTLGRTAEAEQTLKEALGGCDNPALQGRLYAGLAGVYMETGRLKEADEAFERAIEIHRAVGDRRFLGIALTNRAIHFRHTGQGESPRRLLEEALKLHRTVGNRRFEGRTLLALGGAYRTAEEHDRAEEFYLQALSIFEEIGAGFEVAQAWGNLANQYLVTKQLDRAESSYLRALKAMQQIGAQRSVAIVTGNLASLYWTLGRLMLSNVLLRRAIGILEQLGDRVLLAAYRANLGEQLLQLGKLDEAQQQLERAHEDGADVPGSIAMIDYVLPTLFKLHLARASGVYGPAGDPDARNPDALKDAEAVLRQMRVTAKEGQQESTVSLTRQVSTDLKRFVQVQKAIDDGDEPQLFNGHDLTTTPPLAVRALLARLEQTAPDQYQRLREKSANYFAHILEHIGDIKEPDWRDDEPPL